MTADDRPTRLPDDSGGSGGPEAGAARVLWRLRPLLSGIDSEPELLQGVLDRLTAEPGVDGAWVGRPDRAGRFRVRAWTGEGMRDYLDRAEIRSDAGRLADGPSGRSWRRGETIVVPDWERDPHMDPWRALGFGWRASATFPLSGSREPLGLISLYSRTRGRFAGWEPLLSWIGWAVGARLERMETDGAQDAYARLLDALVSIQERHLHELDEAALAARVVDVLYDTGLFPIVWFGRRRVDGTPDLLAARGLDRKTIEEFMKVLVRAREARVPLLVDRVLREGRAIWTDDYAAEPLLDQPEAAEWAEHVRRSDLRQVAVAPVSVGEKVAGALTVAARGELDVPRLLPLLERGGQILGVALERARREARLVASLGQVELQARAIAAAGQGILISDARAPDHPVLYANPAFTRITGYPAAEVIGRNCRFLQGPDTDVQARLMMRAALAAGRPVTVTLLNYRKDGTPFWNEVSLAPVRAEDGTLTHYIGLQSDVSARLREQEYQRLTGRVFENAQEGIIITDAQRRILQVNPAFTRISGYSAEDVIGRTPSLLRSGRHGAGFYRRMWRALEEEGHWQGEIWNRRKDGRIYPELLSVSAVRDAGGRLTHYVGIFTDITEAKAREDELHRAAYHDFLTGLPNRYALDQQLEAALPRALRHERLLAIGLLDLDGFKAVNDTHGHPAGDELLRVLAGRLREALRASDFIARLSGDEFVLMMEDLTHWGDLEPLLERIHKAVATPFVLGEMEVRIGACLGLTIFPLDEAKPRELLRHIDLALYESKRGRSADEPYYRLYRPDQADGEGPAAVAARARLRALMQRSLEVEYQPIVSLAGGPVGRVEALARMREAGRVLSPEDFLPYFSPDDRRRLSLMVLDRALAQLCEWDRCGLRLSVSVNFEPWDLLAPEIVEEVGRRIEAYGVEPGRVTLELLESSDLLIDEVARRRLGELRARGVRLALDDLGSAYASLERLRSLPVDLVKVDRDFCIGLERRPRDLRFLLSLVDLAQGLGVDFVAEGVESLEVLDAARVIGVPFAQGYAISRPLDGEALLAFARAGPLRRPAPSTGFVTAYAAHLVWSRGIRALLVRAPHHINAMLAGERADPTIAQALRRLPAAAALAARHYHLVEEIAAGTVPVAAGLEQFDRIERELLAGLEAAILADVEDRSSGCG